MSGHPMWSDTEFAASETAAGMTAEEIDATLSAMALAATALLQECKAVQQRREEWDTLSEGEIRDRSGHPGLPYRPERVLLSVRLQLATDSARAYESAAHEFVSWWTDIAMAAWRSAVHGTPLLRARMGGAAPNTLMTKEELALLPRVDEHTRQLVELGAFLSAPMAYESAHDHDQDLEALTTDLGARSGLRVQWDETGKARALPEDEPEARRRRLWGDFWIEHRIPRLPDPHELNLLAAHAPSQTAESIRTAAKAVIESVSARQRLSEMENNEAPWTPVEATEYDCLSALWNDLTTRLADFAQVITAGLPEIRAAHSDQDGNGS
ncbi:hypothetical protein [Streptomyces violaceorubidus]|uniref:hypothetical protein n=1 Tax=Streptomyces violaceorubidus TaxID=284042 RepID=UPI0004BF3C60|nr:hypothetical protein [Streptomyces violaceorubidus]